MAGLQCCAWCCAWWLCANALSMRKPTSCIFFFLVAARRSPRGSWVCSPPPTKTAAREGAVPMIRPPGRVPAAPVARSARNFTPRGRLYSLSADAATLSALDAPYRLLPPARCASSAFPHAWSPVHVCIRPPRNARRRLTAASAPMPCRKTDPEITQIFSRTSRTPIGPGMTAHRPAQRADSHTPAEGAIPPQFHFFKGLPGRPRMRLCGREDDRSTGGSD